MTGESIDTAEVLTFSDIGWAKYNGDSTGMLKGDSWPYYSYFYRITLEPGTYYAVPHAQTFGMYMDLAIHTPGDPMGWLSSSWSDYSDQYGGVHTDGEPAVWIVTETGDYYLHVVPYSYADDDASPTSLLGAFQIGLGSSLDTDPTHWSDLEVSEWITFTDEIQGDSGWGDYTREFGSGTTRMSKSLTYADRGSSAAFPTDGTYNATADEATRDKARRGYYSTTREDSTVTHAGLYPGDSLGTSNTGERGGVARNSGFFGHNGESQYDHHVNMDYFSFYYATHWDGNDKRRIGASEYVEDNEPVGSRASSEYVGWDGTHDIYNPIFRSWVFIPPVGNPWDRRNELGEATISFYVVKLDGPGDSGIDQTINIYSLKPENRVAQSVVDANTTDVWHRNAMGWQDADRTDQTLMFSVPVTAHTADVAGGSWVAETSEDFTFDLESVLQWSNGADMYADFPTDDELEEPDSLYFFARSTETENPTYTPPASFAPLATSFVAYDNSRRIQVRSFGFEYRHLGGQYYLGFPLDDEPVVPPSVTSGWTVGRIAIH